MNDDLTNRLRRRLVAGGAGALASAGLGTLGRSAFAQGSGELPALALPSLALPSVQLPSLALPFANGKRKLVAYREKRPLIVLTSRPPQLETPFEVSTKA